MQLLHARSGNAVVFDDFIGKGRRRCTTSAARKADAKGLTMPQLFPNDCDAIFRGVPVVQLSILFQSYIPHSTHIQRTQEQVAVPISAATETSTSSRSSDVGICWCGRPPGIIRLRP